MLYHIQRQVKSYKLNAKKINKYNVSIIHGIDETIFYIHDDVNEIAKFYLFNKLLFIYTDNILKTRVNKNALSKQIREHM